MNSRYILKQKKKKNPTRKSYTHDVNENNKIGVQNSIYARTHL